MSDEGPDYGQQEQYEQQEQAMNEAQRMSLWERVCVTDPKHVKPITGKDYGGNSPKPYWIVQRLTEEFGPCGIGWGYEILSERFERFSESDTLHVARVRLWYVLDGRRGEVEQMGQTKASYVTSKGLFKLDEDAPKKSVTDALVKCASYLGFAGDIFSGRWDDSKYIAWAKEQYADTPQKADNIIPASFRSSALNDADGKSAIDLLPEDQQDYLRSLALDLTELTATDSFAAVDRIAQENLDNEQKMGLWCLLDSKTRSAIKKAQQQLREKEAA